MWWSWWTEASNQFLDKPHEMLVLVLGGFTWFGIKWTVLRNTTHFKTYLKIYPSWVEVYYSFDVLCSHKGSRKVMLLFVFNLSQLWWAVLCIAVWPRERERLGVDCSFYCNKTKCWQRLEPGVISLSRGCPRRGIGHNAINIIIHLISVCQKTPCRIIIASSVFSARDPTGIINQLPDLSPFSQCPSD